VALLPGLSERDARGRSPNASTAAGILGLAALSFDGCYNLLHPPGASPSIGRKVALYAIFLLSAIQ